MPYTLLHRPSGVRLYFFRLATVGLDMFSFDTYQEVLSEHAEGGNLVMSAWFIVIAIAVFMIASA